MEEKKVSTSIEILIRVADFESIRIAKYAEKKIIYESEEERIKKEDAADAELVGDIVRCMRGLPDKLGKKTIIPVAAIEDKIVKKIPEWLANNPIPNLAKDAAEKGDMEASNKVEDKKEKERRHNGEIEGLFDTSTHVSTHVSIPLVPEPEKPVEKVPEKPPEKKIDLNDDDLFNDEELFK